ncbi:MAG: dihydropteroate synthase [bacterium]
MGILNVTPDSFSDGGDFLASETDVAHAAAMLDDGAQIIDVGGESTRPGSDPVSPEEELRRVVPAIRGILDHRPGTILSIDTYRAATAEAALEAGAAIVNDVSALRADPALADVVADAGCPVVLMHMLGEPKTMQRDPNYEDVVREVRDFLAERAEYAEAAGIAPENVVLDPGIGFGKTTEHNLRLLSGLSLFHGLGCVLLLLTGFLVVPAFVALYYDELDSVRGCILAAFVSASIGAALVWFNRGSTVTEEGRTDYFRREGLAVVGLTWLVVAAIGALPYLFSGVMSSPVDAFFESASGFTTTGSTILLAAEIDFLLGDRKTSMAAFERWAARGSAGERWARIATFLTGVLVSSFTQS